MKPIRMFFTLFVVWLTVSACTTNDIPLAGKKVSAEVVKVVDGDTINVSISGTVESVRFLLIDTPEMYDDRWEGPQPYALEAKQFVIEQLKNGNIQLEVDISERDKYGRLLAYIWIGDKTLQEKLLEAGLARVAYVYAPNVRYVDEFRVVQEKAQKQGVGIWSIENYATANKPSESEQQSSECLIKGNITSKGDRIYHILGGRYYDQTKPEKWFCTEQEAEAEGFRKSKQ